MGDMGFLRDVILRCGIKLKVFRLRKSKKTGEFGRNKKGYQENP
jgi:hypothetical protein